LKHFSKYLFNFSDLVVDPCLNNSCLSGANCRSFLNTTDYTPYYDCHACPLYKTGINCEYSKNTEIFFILSTSIIKLDKYNLNIAAISNLACNYSECKSLNSIYQNSEVNITFIFWGKYRQY